MRDHVSWLVDIIIMSHMEVLDGTILGGNFGEFGETNVICPTRFPKVAIYYVKLL